VPYLFRRDGDGSGGSRRGAVVVEVRRQFKEIKESWKHGEAEYGVAVDMLTRRQRSRK